MTSFVFGGDGGFGGAFFPFDDFPVSENVSGGFGRGGAEDMRVAAHHFVVDFADNVGNGETFFLVGNLGMEKHLKEEVAKLFGELGVVGGVESIEDLVGFFDEIGAESGVGLLAVPGTTARGAETSHDGNKPFEVAA